MSHLPPSDASLTPADETLRGSMRARIAHPLGGAVIMTGFPGLETGFDGTATFLPEACRDTLDGIRAQGGDSLVVLVERDELDPIGFDLLERTAAEVGLALQYFPIVDYSVPSDAGVQAWTAQRAARAAKLRAGGTLAFSCQYGAGRSGLMAAWCLMEAGISAAQAIALVRSHFAEAVESEAQEEWLSALQISEAQ
ncbi:protein-tyrosine phosphatase family protein [Gymnodinialimonas sp.]